MNFVFICIVTAILLIVSGIEFLWGQIPCCLCYLQRAALWGVGMGLLLNLAYGSRAIHYGIAILWALFGLGVSIKHVVLGMHSQNVPFLLWGQRLSVWSFVVFACSLVALGVLAVGSRQREFRRGWPFWVGFILLGTVLFLGIFSLKNWYFG